MKKYPYILLSLWSLWFNNGFAQPGNILNNNKISATSGNFSGLGTNYRTFGGTVTIIGDLDKDGIEDLASYAYNMVDLTGVVFILFMNTNQTVKSYSIIGENKGGLNGTFGNMQSFGTSIVSLGDIDGDGNNDLLVGNSSGGGTRGEVYVLLMNPNGTVKQYQIIGDSQIGLTNSASFGLSATLLGDINKDGKKEVAITSTGNQWAIHIISLNSSGTLSVHKKINETSGGFTGNANGSLTVASAIGDINNDSIIDLVASNSNRNELWVLFLDTSGTVKSHQRIAQGVGGYTDTIRPNEFFGITLAPTGDMDGDGVPDLVVGSEQDSVGGIMAGRVRILFMNTNGTVKGIKRIDYASPGFNFPVANEDYFGRGLSGGFDINGDFKNDLLIGAFSTDDGGQNKGAIYLLSLDGAVHPSPPKAQWRVNATSGNQNTVFTFTQYSTGFPSQYKWSFTPNTVVYQNNTTDTSANPVVKFTQSANYSVQLKVTNPFSADSLLRSNHINIQTVGLSSVTNNSNAVTLYPNPATARVQVQSPINMQAIFVYDMAGKQALHHTPHNTTDELNLTHLNKGVYVIHIQTQTGITIKKMIKE